jgi:hypothetical protein
MKNHEYRELVECLDWFAEKYDINDYTASFTAP